MAGGFIVPHKSSFMIFFPPIFSKLKWDKDFGSFSVWLLKLETTSCWAHKTQQSWELREHDSLCWLIAQGHSVAWWSQRPFLLPPSASSVADMFLRSVLSVDCVSLTSGMSCAAQSGPCSTCTSVYPCTVTFSLPSASIPPKMVLKGPRNLRTWPGLKRECIQFSQHRNLASLKGRDLWPMTGRD